MESETAAPHTRRRTLLASGAVALLLATATPGAADPVRVEVVPQGDRARLTARGTLQFLDGLVSNRKVTLLAGGGTIDSNNTLLCPLDRSVGPAG